MKPRSPSTDGEGQFPHTDYFFHSGFGHWHGGYFSPYDGEDRHGVRNFYNLAREFRIEAARERAKEMAVFALIALHGRHSGETTQQRASVGPLGSLPRFGSTAIFLN